MMDRVLFPTDGSDGARTAFEDVLDFVELHGSTLHLLNVADTTHDSVTRIGGDVVDVLEREGRQIVEDAAERAEERGVSTVTEVLQGSVPDTIVAYADRHDIDLIGMPTHGRTGLERFLLGSVTERVIRGSTVPVLTLRPDDTPAWDTQVPYRRVLVPTDGSAGADAALEVGVDLTTAATATVHILSVVETTRLGIDIHSALHADEQEAQANEDVAAATAVAEDAAVEDVVGAIEQGASVHRTIRSYIDDHEIDLVVMGTGRADGKRPLLGSTTEKLVRTSPVPLVAVPSSETDA